MSYLPLFSLSLDLAVSFSFAVFSHEYTHVLVVVGAKTKISIVIIETYMWIVSIDEDTFRGIASQIRPTLSITQRPPLERREFFTDL